MYTAIIKCLLSLCVLLIFTHILACLSQNATPVSWNQLSVDFCFADNPFLLDIYSAPLWGFVVAFMLFNVKGTLIGGYHIFTLTLFWK